MTKNDHALLDWDKHKVAAQAKLGELVQYFQMNLPTGNNGIPQAYIDPTVISPIALSVESPDDVPNDVLAQAQVPIEFDEGFPTVCGVPLWERLDGEPIPYYNMFKQYREMRYIEGVRSIARLMDVSQMPGRALNALSRVYHWQIRVKCYDKYKEQLRLAAKEREIEKLENKHAKISAALLDQAVAYLEHHPDELTPKTAIELLQLAMRAGRLSVGLSPDKPTGGEGGGNGNGARYPSINITNQQTNQTADTLQQIDVNPLSAAQRQVGEDAKDFDKLQSVLQVLTHSGALNVSNKQATQTTSSRPLDALEVVDADYDADYDYDDDNADNDAAN